MCHYCFKSIKKLIKTIRLCEDIRIFAVDINIDGTIILSPKKQKEFIQQILDVNPNIKVDKRL